MSENLLFERKNAKKEMFLYLIEILRVTDFWKFWVLSSTLKHGMFRVERSVLSPLKVPCFGVQLGRFCDEKCWKMVLFVG